MAKEKQQSWNRDRSELLGADHQGTQERNLSRCCTDWDSAAGSPVSITCPMCMRDWCFQSQIRTKPYVSGVPSRRVSDWTQAHQALTLSRRVRKTNDHRSSAGLSKTVKTNSASLASGRSYMVVLLSAWAILVGNQGVPHRNWLPSRAHIVVGDPYGSRQLTLLTPSLRSVVFFVYFWEIRWPFQSLIRTRRSAKCVPSRRISSWTEVHLARTPPRRVRRTSDHRSSVELSSSEFR